MSARSLESYLPELANPDLILDELDRVDSEESLRDFIKLSWHILEPGRKFVPGWHIDAICDHLEAVTRGDINRLLINIPPGCMKSLTTDVFWPAWEWGPKNMPQRRYVSSSYSQDLTIRDNRRTRRLISSPWYQQKWGDRFQPEKDQNAKTRFDNDKTGFKIATSVGGLGTGERGDRFIIDDPHNIKDGESDAIRGEAIKWFLEVVPTRVTDPEKSAIIVIMQRVHTQDVAGTILEMDLGYTHLRLPMEYEPDTKCMVEVTGFEDPRTEENELLWPERMTRAVVERDKKSLGEYGTAGQFQQRPSPRGGGMFKRHWWKFYASPGNAGRPDGCNKDPVVALPNNMDWVLISMDASFKKTVKGSRVGLLVVAGKGANCYVLDNRTRPMSFGESCDEIQQLHKEYPQALRILIEDKANGSAIIDTLNNKVPGIIGINPEGGKESRAWAIQPAVEAGNVYIPEGLSWNASFVSEFATFPSTEQDDQVDALSQALIFMTHGSDVVRAQMMGTM